LARRRLRRTADDSSLVAWHTAKLGDRWAALKPIRQGVSHAFGVFGMTIARGLHLRCDWAPQYIADAASTR
jgi:hypothetical protein